MKIYLDTANVEEIKKGLDTYLIDGVTTNPTLISKEKKDFEKTLKQIVELFRKEKKDFTISAELTQLDDINLMIKQAKNLSKIDKNIIIKVPMSYNGLKVVKILSDLKIRTNVTLIFNANQALLASKAGAWCVSPFIGRLDDYGQTGLNLISQIKQIFTNYNFETKILAASIRNPQTVMDCALQGADIVTIPYKVFENLDKHPLTEFGLLKFQNDWDEYTLNLKKLK